MRFMKGVSLVDPSPGRRIFRPPRLPSCAVVRGSTLLLQTLEDHDGVGIASLTLLRRSPPSHHALPREQLRSTINAHVRCQRRQP